MTQLKSHRIQLKATRKQWSNYWQQLECKTQMINGQKTPQRELKEISTSSVTFFLHHWQEVAMGAAVEMIRVDLAMFAKLFWKTGCWLPVVANVWADFREVKTGGCWDTCNSHQKVDTSGFLPSSLMCLKPAIRGAVVLLVNYLKTIIITPN